MGNGASNKVSFETPPSPKTEKPSGWYALFGGIVTSSKCKEGQEIIANRSTSKYRAKLDPRVLVKYEVKALIGRGSFSKAVRAFRKSDKQSCAIKIIDLHTKEGKSARDAEVRVLGRVRYEYIVRLIEVIDVPNDQSYIVMELATGGNIFDRIRSNGVFPEQDAVRVIKMVLHAVKYLHMLGITHRDLKPENVLFKNNDKDSKILITDFSVASTRVSGNHFIMTSACGTKEYMAPRVLLKKPYTNAVDEWAIGIITYVLLSGVKPFQNNNCNELYKSIIHGDFSFECDPWPEISDSAKDFITKFLTVDYKQRMTTRNAFMHPWVVDHSVQSISDDVLTPARNLIPRVFSRSSSQSVDSDESFRSFVSKHRNAKAREFNDLAERYL